MGDLTQSIETDSIYISIPYKSSSVLKFLKTLSTNSRESDDDVKSIRNILGVFTGVLNEDVLFENENTPIQQNRDITLFQNITMFDNVNQAANEVSGDCSEDDLAITPIHEQSFNNLIIDTDTYEENVP